MDPTPNGTDAPPTTREVLEYFLRNPQAVDNLEGVARWRLQDEAVWHTVEQVAEALGWLVDQGFLVRETAAGVPAVFRLNRNRADEAQRFVTEATAGTEAQRPPRRPVRLPEPRSAGGAPGERLLTCVRAWIDAVLLRYHAANPPAGGDVPGFTRSQATVEAALRPRESSPGPGAAEAERAVDRTAAELAAAVDAAGDHEPLADLVRRLGLTSLELHAVLLCLAPELDPKYQIVFGVLNDDLGRRTVTLGLLCALIGEPLAVRAGLAASGGLVQWRLLERGATLPYADEPLRLDPGIVAWVLGDGAPEAADPSVAGVVRTEPWAGSDWIHDDPRVRDLARRLVRDPDARGWIALVGDDSDGWRAAVEAAAADASLGVLRVPLAAVARLDGDALEDVCARLARAARLADAIPVIDAAGAGVDDHRSLAALVASFESAGTPGVIVVRELQHAVQAIPRTGVAVLHRDRPDGAALATVFAAAAAAAGLELSRTEAERLATAFPLPLDALQDAVRLAAASPTAGQPGRQFAALWSASRRIASPDLPRFARRIEPVFRLDDVVLPADRHAQLAEIVSHVLHASKVLKTWGFDAQLPYGGGVAALFTGPSGTGKTMAAQAIARELGTDAYVVDLSRVVSKWIGETEKNLADVFDAAERTQAVLLFDEADALFGKRSEVKDAHDRYANIEVAYLLQRMEAFSGLAILTTNFRQNLDQAFLRRLRFVVEFPKPHAEAREAIWRKCLPAAAPVGPGVDVRFLARRLELTGGNIRQITLRAAFAAAAENAATIEMRHVITATRAELSKLGMTSAERELAQLAPSLAGGAVQAA